jgi:hypothetical protein
MVENQESFGVGRNTFKSALEKAFGNAKRGTEKVVKSVYEQYKDRVKQQTQPKETKTYITPTKEERRQDREERTSQGIGGYNFPKVSSADANRFSEAARGYYVDDRYKTDYAPYGRNKLGTPYRADGSIIGFAGAGDRYKELYGQEGYDPTGQSDPRKYEDTLYVGDPTQQGWSTTSGLTDPQGAQADVEYFNKYGVRRGGDTGGSYSGSGSYGGGGSYGGTGMSTLDQYMQAIGDQASSLQRQQEELARQAREMNIGSLGQASSEALRQAYIRKMQEERALPEQLQALGISGGAAESTAAGIQSAYGQNVSNIERQRLQELADIEKAYSQNQANIGRDYSQTMMSQYASALPQYLQQQREEQQAQREAQQAELDRQNKLAMAQLAAQQRAQKQTTETSTKMSDQQKAYLDLMKQGYTDEQIDDIFAKMGW